MKVLFLCLTLAACGSSSSSPPADDDGDDCGQHCETPPTVPLTILGGQPANLACGAPSIVLSTAPLDISGVVKDFQTSTKHWDGAGIEAFVDLDLATPTGTTTSDAAGAYGLSLPAGGAASLMHFRVKRATLLDTVATYVPIDVSQTAVAHDLLAVSVSTANAIATLLSTTREPGKGLFAGSVYDCDGQDVTGAVVRVTSAPGTEAASVTGTEVYYFSMGQPVEHRVQPFTNRDGLFVALQVPTGAPTYLQVWGFKTAADVAAGNLQLISQTELPVLADTLVTANLWAGAGL